MRTLTTSLVALFLLFSCLCSAQESITMNWDIFAEKLPTRMHIELMDDGQLVQSLDLYETNALEIKIPTESFLILIITSKEHKDRKVYIDTHHAYDNKKEAKKNKQFVYDLYLEGKEEEADDAYMLHTISFEKGTSRILFDELLTELNE